MQETLQQRESNMKTVMRQIVDEKPFNKFSFEEQRIAKECYEAGFFEGVVILEMISGRIVAEYRHKPRFTYKGLAFLEKATEDPAADKNEQKNNFVQKILNHLKPPVKIAWKLFVGFSVFVTVLGWPLIMRLLSFLLSLFQK